MLHRSSFRSVALALALVTAACGGGGGDGVLDPAELALDAIEPPYAVQGSTDPVLLRGRGFSSGQVRVFFGEVEASGVEVLDDARLRCLPPDLPPGEAGIRVETAIGTVSLPRAFHAILDRLEDYHHVAHLGIEEDHGHASALWGTVSFDPVDEVLYGSHHGVTSGEPFGPVYQVAVPYTVDADDRMRWEPGDGSAWEGAVTADGLVIGLTTASPGAHPALALLTRKEGAFTDADLSGTYHLGAFGFESHLGSSWWGSVTFDGSGHSALRYGSNWGGIVTDVPADTVSGTYTVGADGAVAFQWDEGTPFLPLQGGVLPGGDLVVLSAGLDGPRGTYPEWELVTVLVRAATAPASPVLSGSWRVVGIVAEEFDSEWRWASVSGTASMVTTDSLALEDLLLNDGGVISSVPSPVVFTTTPGPEGAFTAQMDSSGYAFVGGLSPNGRFAVLAGSTNLFEPNSLYVLFR